MLNNNVHQNTTDDITDNLAKNIDVFKSKLNVMGKKVITIGTLNAGLAGMVYSVETEDGESYILKNYSSNSENSIMREWNALNMLYDAGFSVPKPYSLIEDGIVMQKINGKNLWDAYENASQGLKDKYVNEFANLLIELHSIDTCNNNENIGDTNSFVQNEIDIINDLRSKHSIFDYDKSLEKLQLNSKKISNAPLSIIHRDYHPWNVLIDAEGKLYVIDLICDTGDFRMDVAYTYNLMRRSEFGHFGEQFLKCYAASKPNVMEDFMFFRHLAALRWVYYTEGSVRSGDGEQYDFLADMIQKCLCDFQ